FDSSTVVVDHLFMCDFSIFFFFFSSRIRHTSSKRDWSSDVCSSDLCNQTCASSNFFGNICPKAAVTIKSGFRSSISCKDSSLRKIGRASCRERVEFYVVSLSFWKKISHYGFALEHLLCIETQRS